MHQIRSRGLLRITAFDPRATTRTVTALGVVTGGLHHRLDQVLDDPPMLAKFRQSRATARTNRLFSCVFRQGHRLMAIDLLGHTGPDGWGVAVLEHQARDAGRFGRAGDAAQVPDVRHPVERHQEARRQAPRSAPPRLLRDRDLRSAWTPSPALARCGRIPCSASSAWSSRREALPSPSGRTTRWTRRRPARSASITGRAPSIRANCVGSGGIARTLPVDASLIRPFAAVAPTPAELLLRLPPGGSPHLLERRGPEGWTHSLLGARARRALPGRPRGARTRRRAGSRSSAASARSTPC